MQYRIELLEKYDIFIFSLKHTNINMHHKIILIVIIYFFDCPDVSKLRTALIQYSHHREDETRTASLSVRVLTIQWMVG